MNKKVVDFLLKCGIKPHLQGFMFIISAVDITLENKDTKLSMMKKIYPEVAKIYNTTPIRVERGIRNAIWKANKDYKGIKNSEFIAMIALKIKVGEL